MKVYLVRHGETDWNLRGMFYGWTDCDINEKGIMQAERLKKYFGTISYDKIYASDLLRAAHTAEIIAEDKKIDVLKDSCFRELHYGDWEDKEGSYIRENHGEELSRWLKEWKTSAFPGGEAFFDFYQRVTDGLIRVIEENKSKNVIIVSHNGPMSAMLCYLTGVGPDGFWRFFSEQGCYSSAFISEKKITIEKINCPV
ncbi:phosphoserine phosphatase 1 [Anaerotignum neopropionicum]|uniref:phosphoglycerate mutase (2,3-diphosphoglycerate-dependent) n=1 Tax=Anaerotignum neopropionicum TaxID=36847 RepID=A0A136WF03_9FIRM|nr:histidine phosphatase family protein [Anaerotignum neopropionicum]KXL53075.1 phosphoserine phosphatase 1 [Anaerotignum neopropionicum]